MYYVTLGELFPKSEKYIQYFFGFEIKYFRGGGMEGERHGTLTVRENLTKDTIRIESPELSSVF